MADTPSSPQTVVSPHDDVTVGMPNSGGTDEVLEQHNGGDKQRDLMADQPHSLVTIPRIPRFPLKLQEFGKARGYIAPRVVAIGPYHHGKVELRAMEEVKRRVIDHFFQQSPVKEDEAKKEIMPIAREARGYYDYDVVKGMSEDEFRDMMFADGCFLVQFIDYMTSGNEKICPSWLERIIQLHYISIMIDMMLLENQIPWPVMKFLMARWGLPRENLVEWLTLALNDSWEKKSKIVRTHEGLDPLHLLELLHYYKVDSKPVDPKTISDKDKDISAVCTGAAELAEMGIKLEACKTRLFSDMQVVPTHVFAKLSLMPLALDNCNASWLLNMAAFEMCTTTKSEGWNYINAYLSVIGLLMEEENDVTVLRTKRIITATTMSNRQTLKFFKGMSPNLMPGLAYLLFIEQLEAYKQKRWVRIAVYRFFYTNTKTIATVLSIIGVLASIFKILLSLK